jgi:hypothetical protein
LVIFRLITTYASCIAEAIVPPLQIGLGTKYSKKNLNTTKILKKGLNIKLVIITPLMGLPLLSKEEIVSFP